MEPNNTTNNNNNIEMWEWCGEDFLLQRDSEFDLPQCIWDSVDQNDNNFLSSLDEHTPTKSCTDNGYDITYSGDKSAGKGLEASRESSVKRRRMLQFTADDDAGTSMGNQHTFSAPESSKALENSFFGDELLECLEWDPEWSSGLSDDRCDLSSESLGQSSSGLSTNYVNQIQMQYTPPEMSSSVNDYAVSDDQVEILDYRKVSPEIEIVAEQKKSNVASCRVFRGRKSYMKTPTKLTTSVAYPFTLIKPCGAQGDVTLKDINRRIHPPPLSKSKGEDARYPTSAYSGKPVVVKTKIRTEGGKGSITIMRTKG